MVVGHQPFQAPTFAALSRNILSGNVIETNQWKNTPKEVKRFIMSILVQKNRPSAGKILATKIIKQHLQNTNKVAIKKLMRTIKSIQPDSQFSLKVKLSNKLKIILYKMLAPLNLIHDLSSLERL